MMIFFSGYLDYFNNQSQTKETTFLILEACLFGSNVNIISLKHVMLYYIFQYSYGK